MSESASKIQKLTKSKAGGARKGAGRPPGPSKATLARARRVQKEVKKALAAVAPEKLDELASDPLEALRFALRCHLGSGDLAGIAAVAEKMLPYIRAKVASMEPMMPLPDDLLPDAAPEPDEPGPEHVIDLQPPARLN